MFVQVAVRTSQEQATFAQFDSHFNFLIRLLVSLPFLVATLVTHACGRCFTRKEVPTQINLSSTMKEGLSIHMSLPEAGQHWTLLWLRARANLSY